MTVVTPKFGMGASVLRLEDQAFITGKGRYTDDIAPDGLLHGYVLRSPVAKARFTIGSTEAAKAAPGVHLVLTGADLGASRRPEIGVMQKQPDGTKAPTRDIPILCRDQVNYVGDAVAFVVADSRALAQDAAELIEVDYDAEDAAAEHRDGARPGYAAGLAGARHEPRLHLPSSATATKAEAAFAKAPQGHAHRVRQQPAGLQLHGAALGDRRMEAPTRTASC